MADQRMEAGIAIGIVILFVALAAGAILFILMTQVTPPVFDAAAPYTAGTPGAKGGTWLQQAISWWPLYVLFVSFFGIIARATFQSEVT